MASEIINNTLLGQNELYSVVLRLARHKTLYLHAGFNAQCQITSLYLT